MFPMKIRHFISWSNKNYHAREGMITESTRDFQEKITVDFIKVAALSNVQYEFSSRYIQKLEVVLSKK